MIYSPGDFLDKWSILNIKKEKGLEVEKEILANKPEFNSLFTSRKENDALDLYIKLLDSNRYQFDLEDKIRVEKDLSVVGQIALDIRKQNDYRVELKNKINEIFKYAYMEVKEYKR